MLQFILVFAKNCRSRFAEGAYFLISCKAFERRGLISKAKKTGGEGGIRTHGTLSGTTVFETVRFNRSRTSPPMIIANFVAALCCRCPLAV